MSDPDDVMFSPSVKAEQTRLGSRAMFEGRAWKTEITDDLRQFLGVIDTFSSTASPGVIAVERSFSTMSRGIRWRRFEVA